MFDKPKKPIQPNAADDTSTTDEKGGVAYEEVDYGDMGNMGDTETTIEDD